MVPSSTNSWPHCGQRTIMHPADIGQDEWHVAPSKSTPHSGHS